MKICKIIIALFCLTSCLSYAQNTIPIPIPVVPDEEETFKQSESQKKHQISEEAVDDPASLNVNQESIFSQIVPGSTFLPRSIADLADKITSAQVEHFGGEAGGLRVRLRGSRAFEPSYYFNGFALAGAGSGEQNLSLLPTTFVGLLNVYPDSPPFWLSSMGIAGDINIQSCRRIECFTFGKSSFTNLFKIASRVGSYGYKEISSNYSLKLSKQTEIFTTIDYAKSNENYPVFNNQNSYLHADQGVDEQLQNNDFSKTSGGIGISNHSQIFGKINFDLAFGLQDKGVPAQVASQGAKQRLKRNLIVSTLKSQKIFPNSGLQWNNQIGFLYNTGESKNFNSSFIGQAAKSINTSLQAKSYFILPTNVINQEQTGISFDILRSTQETNTIVPNSSTAEMNSSVHVDRTEVRSALFEALIFPLATNWTFSSNANGWISFSKANLDMQSNYPSVQNSSPSQYSNRENQISGYTFSLQNKFYSFVHYIRYVKSQRRPYLSEIYGSPDGIVPNLQLQSENSAKVETGLSVPFGEIGYFHAKDRNLIYLKDISQTNFQYQNIEDSYRDGFFVNADYYLTSHWNSGFSYQYIIAKMSVNGETSDVPRSARHYATASTSLEDISMGALFGYQAKFGIYANMNWQSSFYLDYTNSSQMETPPLYNSGLAFSFHSVLLSQVYSVSLDIYNIADESFATLSNSNGAVQSVQSNGYLGYPPPGRRVYLTLSGEF